MSTHKELKKITTNTLQKMKSNGEKISMITAYDYSFAKIFDAAGIDVILVGDSASNVMAGHETTLPITLDQIIYHAGSVIRGVDRSLVIVDLPFGSYQSNSKEALASMGQMKLRHFVPPAEETMTKAQELQLMIRHPNNSGLQRDPLTQYFIPAHFVQNLSISQGDRLILSMEGGISISEDPNFRFDFAPGSGGEIRVEATDTEGKVFNGQWPLEAVGL